MIKVLIVDDSAFMRMTIRKMLETDPDIKVIGVARNGVEAVKKTISLKPDVITMDITMPDMDGIEAVENIMAKNPTPIIMISATTNAGARATVSALEKGAVDYISKEELNTDILLKKIRLAADINNRMGKASDKYSNINDTQPPANDKVGQNFSVVGIGISTGGPKALNQVLPLLNTNLSAGILIAQHMPPLFTRSLAERLDSVSKVKVKEAQDGEKILPGNVYICPGGMHMAVERPGVITLYPKSKFDYLYVPSVDLLMSSIGNIYGKEGLCIIMTGMGSDGLEGIKSAKKRGCYVLAQSEASSTIYGMPKAIIENNLQDEIVDLKNMAERINCLCSP